MSAASKKERHRLKRKQKHAHLRRERNRSPFQRLAHETGEVECYISAGWEEAEEASIIAFKALSSGRHVMGSYLVDLGVPGLKDAWGRLDITRAEFEAMLERMHERLGVEQLDAEMTRSLVAGGIRFAQMHGFRLPHRFERWVNVLGQVDWRNADISRFKMRFIGSREDLKRRLIGSSVDDFLKRRDIEFIIEVDELAPFDDENSQPAGLFDYIQCRGVGAVRRWCVENQLAPHPMLDEAFEMLLILVAEGDRDEEAAQGRLAELMALRDPAEVPELLDAIEQIIRSLKAATAADRDAVVPLFPDQGASP